MGGGDASEGVRDVGAPAPGASVEVSLRGGAASSPGSWGDSGWTTGGWGFCGSGDGN